MITTAAKKRRVPCSISTGTITEISSCGRFGFITPDCGGLEVFFHISNCLLSDYTPRLHDTVSYLTRLSSIEGRRSPFIAVDMDLLSYTFEEDDNHER